MLEDSFLLFSSFWLLSRGVAQVLRVLRRAAAQERLDDVCRGAGVVAGRANARRFAGKLMEQCKRIGNAALGYTGREDLAPSLRIAALGRYVIFFRVIDGTVRIERVLHGARNLPAVLESDQKSE